jgi:hypothetical protein
MYSSLATVASAALLLVSPATAVLAPAYQEAKCLHERSEEFSQGSSCGNKTWLKTCLDAMPGAPAELKFCYAEAGCSDVEAEYEAGLILDQCSGQNADDVELRRRGLGAMPLITAAPANPLRARQNNAATTTPMSAMTGADCSSDRMVASQTCSTRDAVPTCSEIQVPKPICKAENVCLINAEGVNICVVRNDTLSTDGLIVTIFLAVVFVGGFATLIFLCCRDRRRDKQLRARKEAAAIAKSNMVSKPASPPVLSGPDPFADQSRPAH